MDKYIPRVLFSKYEYETTEHKDEGHLSTKSSFNNFLAFFN